MSGAVFKFVYDSTEAYEPLRDTCPFDLLEKAAARNWFPHARWETDLTLEEAKRIIKREIDAGRPLISPFLLTEKYHGLNIITGYDYDQGILLVQGAIHKRRAETIPLPDGWDGPTVSPAGWASNPLFVLGEAEEDSTATRAIYRDLVAEGLMLLEGGRLEYGRHPGEAVYMLEPGPHEAWFGLPAYEVLAADVADKPLVVEGPDGKVLNFGLVWRIDAMVGLLEHDRTYGPQLTSVLRGFLSEKQAWVLYELSDNFERTADEAAGLRDLFWHEIPDSITAPDDVLKYVGASPAMVFRLPRRMGVADSLRKRGLDVFETLWGKALVEDAPERRVEAKMRAIRIMSRERESMGLLEAIARFIKSKPDMEWPPRRWQPKRMKQD
jgi:hypothetical protein